MSRISEILLGKNSKSLKMVMFCWGNKVLEKKIYPEILNKTEILQKKLSPGIGTKMYTVGLVCLGFLWIKNLRLFPCNIRRTILRGSDVSKPHIPLLKHRLRPGTNPMS